MGNLTLSQWIAIAGIMLKALPDERKALALLSPHIVEIMKVLQRTSATPPEVSANAAGTHVYNMLVANGEAAIRLSEQMGS